MNSLELPRDRNTLFEKTPTSFSIEELKEKLESLAKYDTTGINLLLEQTSGLAIKLGYDDRWSVLRKNRNLDLSALHKRDFRNSENSKIIKGFKDKLMQFTDQQKINPDECMFLITQIKILL